MTLAQWDRLPEAERAWWVAEHELEADRCPQCHGDRAVCSDPEQPFYPQRTVCYSTMALESVQARYDERYGGKFHDGTLPSDPAKWGKERSDRFPFGHREGVSIWVSPEDLTPDADWL